MNATLCRRVTLGALWALLLAFPVAVFSADIQHRLVVRFGSICCGPDREAAAQLAEVVSKYERHIDKPIESKKLRWGKEGDFSLCFKLSELSPSMQMSFVNEVRAAVRSTSVKIDEHVVCAGGWS